MTRGESPGRLPGQQRAENRFGADAVLGRGAGLAAEDLGRRLTEPLRQPACGPER
jgi:hypothetical protein